MAAAGRIVGDHADDAIDQALDEDLDRLMLLADGDWSNDPDGFLFFHPRRPTWVSTLLAQPPRFWLGNDRKPILIKEMGTGHIVNVLNLLERKPALSKAVGGARRAWLKSEARKRGCLQSSPTGRWRTPPADDFTVLTEKPR